MLRLIIASIAVTGAFALAPTAAAAPGMCDKHGTGPGHTYIHACAKGDGGGGSFIRYTDKDGHRQSITSRELYSVKHKRGH
jgi:hypothetical protein